MTGVLRYSGEILRTDSTNPATSDLASSAERKELRDQFGVFQVSPAVSFQPDDWKVLCGAGSGKLGRLTL